MSLLVISLPFFLLHNDKNADDENINRVDVPVFYVLFFKLMTFGEGQFFVL